MNAKCTVRERQVALWLIGFALFAGTLAVGEEVNLLPNGGFEEDGDGDGVADGWIAREFNFSRQTLDQVQSYIDALPAYEKLLAGQQISAADGTSIWTRTSDGHWPTNMLTFGSQYWGEYEKSWKPQVNWYERVKREAIPSNSRFGELPVREDLNLGDVTLVLSSKRPHKQVVSEPIVVKPDTGYRLIFFVRTSGGGEYWRGPQVLDGEHDPASIPIGKDLYGNANVLNAIPATYWWGSGIAGRDWARLELPFRTGADCRSVTIRLPFLYREEAKRRTMHNENYRIWYDDLRLIEDPSVRVAGPADEGYADLPKPAWPAEAVERGFVVAGRPTLPITYSSFKPSLEEADEPIRLTLAPGETESVVVFVQNLLNEPIVLRARAAGGFTSQRGEDYVLHGGIHGARFVTLRAAEMAWRRTTAQSFVYAPKFLLNSNELTVSAGHGGQYWLTMTVPRGTSPGEYTGNVKITRTKPAGGDASTHELSVPVVLTVREFELEDADAAFFVWADVAPVGDKRMGPPQALPGAGQIYLNDQHRHGMNTVGTYCYAESQDSDGKVHIRFNELDAMIEDVRRAGLCENQPLLLYTWSRPLELQGRADFCFFAGGASSVRSISEHARNVGWPDVLMCVGDEPNHRKGSERVARVLNSQYPEARNNGVRTATAGGYPGAFTRPLNEQGDTLGDLYDVWIEGHYGDQWPQMHKAAKENDAELWMYNCWVTGAGYLQERFYAGLWTWRTGVRGNGAWSFGWYVRISDSGLPESKIAWEGRAAGVNDYRYLQTLEHAIAAGESSGTAGAAVKSAKAFLDTLRRRIPLNV